MSLIEARRLTLGYGGSAVLRDVSFAIERGEIVTIVGPNGSGKSSLLRALIGALPPASGKVTRSKGLRIGYVPQKLLIDATLPLTAERFLNLPRRQTTSLVWTRPHRGLINPVPPPFTARSKRSAKRWGWRC